MKKLFSILMVFFGMVAANSKFIVLPDGITNDYKAEVSVTSNYVGEVADVLFALLKSGNQAVEKGSFYVEPGVQKSLFLPRFNADADQLQEREADPTTASDSYTYEERELTPLDAMFFDIVNPRSFESVWRPFQPTGALVDRVDNPAMQAAIIDEAAKSVGTQIGKLIWQGDTTLVDPDPLRFFDGVIKILTADGAINPVPQGAITQGSVLAILAATEAAIPSEIWEDPNFILHMNTTDYRHYLAAARALDFKGIGIEDAGSGIYAGKTIRFYSGMAKDHIVGAKSTAGRDSNLWAGVDVIGDDANVKIARYRPESERFIVKVLFKYGVQVGNPTECVLYLPA